MARSLWREDRVLREKPFLEEGLAAMRAVRERPHHGLSGLEPADVGDVGVARLDVVDDDEEVGVGVLVEAVQVPHHGSQAEQGNRITTALELGAEAVEEGEQSLGNGAYDARAPRSPARRRRCR